MISSYIPKDGFILKTNLSTVPSGLPRDLKRVRSDIQTIQKSTIDFDNVLQQNLDTPVSILSRAVSLHQSLPTDFIVCKESMDCILSTIKETLDQIEEGCSLSTVKQRSQLLLHLHNTLFPDFRLEVLRESQALCESYDSSDEETRKAMRASYKSRLLRYFILSPFVRRALLKPGGYAGDAEMMNQIYEQELLQGSFFASFMHYYCVNEIASRSVYSRKLRLKEIISSVIKNNDNVRILSVACGPASEIIDVLSEADLKGKHITIHLLDQDKLSLETTILNLRELTVHRPEVEIIGHAESVVQIIRKKSALLREEKFDLVYSSGLYDYLKEPMAKALTLGLTDLVQKNGKLVVGNFYRQNRTRAIMDYIMDWILIHRSKEEMEELCPCSSNFNTEVDIDEHEAQLFLTLTFKP